MKRIVLTAAALFISVFGMAQGSQEYGGGLKVNINEDGSKYFRLITWAQFWAQHNSDKPLDANGNEQEDLTFSVRRARMLLYAQLNQNFLIVTHFGLNSLNADNMSPTGTKDNAQLFLHDAYVQYNLGKNHALGGGLHYFNGISRLNSSSTLNMLALDNQRQTWATLGLSDQFGRSMGVFAKGAFSKLQYRVAINDALTNNLQATAVPVNGGDAVYAGKRLLGSKAAGKTYAGYFEYNFLDTESNFLPYKVGSYLGSKKVFNVGAGFYVHPKGSVVADLAGNLKGEDVKIFGLDAFYDAPIGKNGGAITAYGLYQNNNYGKNYTFGTTYETGAMIYGHVGYLIPMKSKTKLQPYVSYNDRHIDALNDNASQIGVGANLFFSAHHSKLTLEYSNLKYANSDAVGTVTLQAMIYL